MAYFEKKLYLDDGVTSEPVLWWVGNFNSNCREITQVTYMKMSNFNQGLCKFLSLSVEFIKELF